MTLDDRLKREKEKLWLTDAELIRRMGVPENIARATLRMLDARPGSGFPRKSKIWGDRRYWPAVEAYFEQHHGATMEPPQQQRGRHGRA